MPTGCCYTQGTKGDFIIRCICELDYILMGKRLSAVLTDMIQLCVHIYVMIGKSQNMNYILQWLQPCEGKHPAGSTDCCLSNVVADHLHLLLQRALELPFVLEPPAKAVTGQGLEHALCSMSFT